MTDKKSNPINEKLNKIPIWNNLDPSKKKRVSVVVISALLLIFMLFAYSVKTSKKEATEAEKPAVIKEISLDEGSIESTLQDLMLLNDKEKAKEVEFLRKEIKSLKERPQRVVVSKDSGNVNKTTTAAHLIPPPPKPASLDSQTSLYGGFPKLPIPSKKQLEMIGGISSSPITVTDEKKIKKKTVWVLSISPLLLWRRHFFPE